MSVKPSSAPLAEYVDQMIKLNGLKKVEVAKALGYERPNIVSMITKGQTKIPLAKIPALADTLGLNRKALLRRALKEYNPELLRVLDEIEGDIVSDNEREILSTIREISDERDPELTTDRRRALEHAFAPSD